MEHQARHDEFDVTEAEFDARWAAAEPVELEHRGKPAASYDFARVRFRHLEVMTAGPPTGVRVKELVSVPLSLS